MSRSPDGIPGGGTPRRRTVLLGLTAGAATALTTGLPLARAADAPYEPVLYWSKILEGAVKATGGAPGPAARAAAIMHLAMYDAANSLVSIGRPYLAKQPVLGTASLNAAIATAAYTALHALYPSGSFDGNYGFALSQDTSSQTEKDKGAAVGRGAAQALVQARANDGEATTVTYTPDGVPGSWRTTGSGPAVTPHWGRVRPFGESTPGQFRPGPPGGFTTYQDLLRSSQYAEQLHEVRVFGGHSSTPLTTVVRTPEQSDIGRFWANDLDGTYKPTSQLYQHARIIARKQALTPTQNVRLFAVLSIALADAAVAAWDAKYDTPIDLWRPVSAINLADSDGNPATTPDPAWRPLSSDLDGTSYTPAFPAYVSGHATFAGAWGSVLRTYFATDAIAFSATTDGGTATRRFNTLSAATHENAISRIYLGVHYRWDAEQGLATGEKVARNVTGTYL
ncbi:vanadium-dependent haloperoxidase [Streptomyces sp. AC536]|uniref:vanadium-dependent haloperoxidase n=1 Tax=Streptomyces buecherae TaxID=2763006 RepID=UPI00164D5A32|nr:vanadium-dependent haloperoxidase [Streptomyces buecherae]MBC3983416.1 vanadium-dependent haloperoxidase [Streptomyces buecherae]QNJ43337.1 vanadium-dependent haloperoxidase [Streptomyces buecherae]